MTDTGTNKRRGEGIERRHHGLIGLAAWEVVVLDRTVADGERGTRQQWACLSSVGTGRGVDAGCHLSEIQ